VTLNGITANSIVVYFIYKLNSLIKIWLGQFMPKNEKTVGMFNNVGILIRLLLYRELR